MARTPEAHPPPTASPENFVRIEVNLPGKRYHHNVATDVFLDGSLVSRRADLVHWVIDVIHVTMHRSTTRDLLGKTLHMLDDEDKWAIVEPIIRELERNGYRFRERY